MVASIARLIAARGQIGEDDVARLIDDLIGAFQGEIARSDQRAPRQDLEVHISVWKQARRQLDVEPRADDQVGRMH